MFRRFLLTSCKSALALFLLICLGCSAQPAPVGPAQRTDSAALAPTEIARRIERQLRASYNVPATVTVRVSAPRASEFPNYDAITVTFDGDGKKQDSEFLLSKDQKTLVRISKMDLSKDPYAETMKKIDVKGRPIRGNPNAKVVVVNYDDFQCPYCSKVHETLFPQLLKEYGDRIAFIYKDFPLSEIHAWASHAAVNANCLAAQSSDAYWDFADYIHSNRDQVNSQKGLDNQFAVLDRLTMTEAGKFKLDAGKLQSCVKTQSDAAVKASVKEGEALGVSGTPTMFVNGQMVDGARPASDFRSVFDSALQQAGVPAATHPSASVSPAPGDHAAVQR
jgi:protein-disulfide isomerase